MGRSSETLPLVSILVPAYNHEQYVQSTIRSIIGQDYPRIELVVTDDGSKDATWSKIQSLRDACEKRFERVVLRTRPNKGCAVTCRENLELAQGDFVGLIASDDEYLSGAVSTLIKGFEDPAVGLSCGINEYMDSTGRTCYVGKNGKNVYQEEDAECKTFNDTIRKNTGVAGMDPQFGSYQALVKGNHIPNGYLIRRKFIQGIDLYIPEAPLEDWWMNLQLSKVARYHFEPIPVFRYRRHGGNTVNDIGKLCAMYNKTGHCEIALLNKMSGDRGREYREMFDRNSHVVDVVWSVPHVVRMERRWLTNGYELNLCVGRHVLFSFGGIRK